MHCINMTIYIMLGIIKTNCILQAIFIDIWFQIVYQILGKRCLRNSAASYVYQIREGTACSPILFSTFGNANLEKMIFFSSGV